MLNYFLFNLSFHGTQLYIITSIEIHLYNHIYTNTFYTITYIQVHFYIITQLQNYTISFMQKQHYNVLRNHGILSVFHTVSYRIILSLAFVISFNMCVNSWCYWTITSVGGLIWLLLNYVTGRKHQFLSLLDHMYSHGN